MTDDQAHALDNFRDAVAIFKAVAEKDTEAFNLLVQHCDQVNVIGELATMLTVITWQLHGESFGDVFERIEQIQQRIRDRGDRP